MQQHEEWMSKHAWGATAMDQDEQIDQAEDEREGFREEYSLDEAATAPTPRTVEGTLVESTLLVPATPPPSISPGEEDDPFPTHSLRRCGQQGIVIVLVALFTVLGLVPTQAAAMRLFVSLVPAAGARATVTLVTDQVDLRRTYTLLAIPAGVTVPTTSHQQPQPQAQVEARLLTAPILTQAVTVPTTGKGHQPATQAYCSPGPMEYRS